jgi:inhibitor of cysteine peptidase
VPVYGGLRVNMKWLAVAMTFFLIVATLACNGNTRREITVSEAQDSQTVQLNVGDTLKVQLEGNPTTGFSWATETLEATVLRQEGEPQYEAESSQLGSGGTYTFTYTVVGKGESSLRLVYRRSWETGVAPEKTYEITVVAD